MPELFSSGTGGILGGFYGGLFVYRLSALPGVQLRLHQVGGEVGVTLAASLGEVAIVAGLFMHEEVRDRVDVFFLILVDVDSHLVVALGAFQLHLGRVFGVLRVFIVEPVATHAVFGDRLGLALRRPAASPRPLRTTYPCYNAKDPLGNYLIVQTADASRLASLRLVAYQ